MSRPPSEMPPGRRPPGGPERRPDGRSPQKTSPPSWTRMLPWLLILAVVGVFALTNVFSSGGSSAKNLTFTQFVQAVDKGEVNKVTFDKTNGNISGVFANTVSGEKNFTTSGPANDM